MLIFARAPVRICDCGGWTDTWFAGHGRVFNIAIRPRAEVRIDVRPAAASRPAVVLDVADFGDRYSPELVRGRWGRHPLLEAAIVHVGLPPGVDLEIRASCAVPPGASTGTSAAITVALVGGLRAARGLATDPASVARDAHAVETVELGRQCGIQDQVCSAHGGVNDILMTAYPDAEVRKLPLGEPMRRAIERRMGVVLLGAGHDSSAVHRRVIERLESQGPDATDLEALRRCAADAAAAFSYGDLEALGRAMIANTEGQRRLHPELVSAAAARVIQVARAHGATGWKVNGAGGEGGSLTLLGAATTSMDALRTAIEAEIPRCRWLPVVIDADGLTVEQR